MEAKNEIGINCVWSASNKQYLVMFDFAAYYKSELDQEKTLQNIHMTFKNTLDFLASNGFEIHPSSVTYSNSTHYEKGDRIGNDEIEIVYFNVPHKHIVYKCKDVKGVGFKIFDNPKNLQDTSVLSTKLLKFYGLFHEKKSYLELIANAINEYLLKKANNPNSLWYNFLKINCRFLNADEKEPYYGRIASGMNEYLLSNAKNSTILDELTKDVTALKVKEEQLNYLTSYIRIMWLAGLLSFIAYFFIPSTFTDSIDVIPFAMIGCAVIGGMFSTILTRSIYKVDLNTPNSFYHSLGYIRLLTAVISGIVSYLAIKSNLFFGAFSNNNFSMYIVAFAAGFSEQFITKIINKVDHNAVTTSNQEKSKIES